MKISFYIVFFIFVCMISCGLYASNGKTDPCIRGQVLDAVTKKPVSGVLVSAISPGDLIPKEVTTDDDGFYVFKQLPSCRVNLRFEKKGYQKYRYQEIVELQEKKTVKVNVEVSPDHGSDNLPEDSEYPLLRVLGMK
jgi:hypothetical protein